MPDAKKQGRSNKAMTFFVCFLAALAGLLFGLDIGVIAGAHTGRMSFRKGGKRRWTG